MSREYIGVNETKIEMTSPVEDRALKVLREITGDGSRVAEGLSKEICIKWAVALEQRRDQLWTSDKNAEWKKYRDDFREGDEAFELGEFFAFLVNCDGIKAVVD